MSSFQSKIRNKMQTAMQSFESRNGGYQPKKKPTPKTRQIIKHTRFDELDWIDARKSQDIEDGIKDMYEGEIGTGTADEPERLGYLNAPELVQDVFYTFIKPVPTLQKKKDVRKEVRLNGKFLEQMMALPEYERLHDQTMTDPMLSTMATGIVMDALKEMIKQHREAVEDANERRRNGDLDDPPDGPPGPPDPRDNWDEETPSTTKPTKGKGESKFNQGEDQDQEQDETEEPDLDEDGNEIPRSPEAEDDTDWLDGDDDDDEDGPNGLIDDQERAWDEALLENDEWDDEVDLEKMLNSQDFARNINSALKEAADSLDELDTLRRGVGIEDSEWKQMDPSKRLAMAERLNTPRMRQIADMVGRMKRFAMAQQAQKIIDAPHEIFDVEMGNDLRRVLRSEFAFLGSEETKIEFFRKYANGELLQFKERGHEDAGKGPIICCIDNSGSMGGTPEEWAKGVAEALRRICAEQNRDFHAIYFETNRHRERFDFPKGQADFEKVLKFLSVSAGGGTEFDGVLTEALAKAANMFDEKQQGKADIVFITDGEAYLDKAWIDKFKEERDRIGCRVFGIYISAYDSTRSGAMKLLESFCQIAIPVKALAVNDEAAATIFSQV
jgi:Mg-chelatase subunit ChlD